MCSLRTVGRAEPHNLPAAASGNTNTPRSPRWAPNVDTRSNLTHFRPERSPRDKRDTAVTLQEESDEI